MSKDLLFRVRFSSIFSLNYHLIIDRRWNKPVKAKFSTKYSLHRFGTLSLTLYFSLLYPFDCYYIINLLSLLKSKTYSISHWQYNWPSQSAWRNRIKQKARLRRHSKHLIFKLFNKKKFLPKTINFVSPKI